MVQRRNHREVKKCLGLKENIYTNICEIQLVMRFTGLNLYQKIKLYKQQLKPPL
jgi:hypothetical protein